MERGQHETSLRRALYNCCSEPVSVLRGTPYPCEQYNLDECLIPDRSAHSMQSPERASSDLECFLNPNVRIGFAVQEAIVRLRRALRTLDWKADLAIKAFKDLDMVFFNCKLQGQTTISWQCAEWWIDNLGSQDGYLRYMASTEYLGHQKAAINLNAWVILLDTPNPKEAMFQNLLHEMVVS